LWEYGSTKMISTGPTRIENPSSYDIRLNGIVASLAYEREGGAFGRIWGAHHHQIRPNNVVYYSWIDTRMDNVPG
jgi:hypothetical protein